MIKQQEIKEFIQISFEENYQQLRQEGGHSLSEHILELARRQVYLYWNTLYQTALNVKETEISLTLPAQTSPKNHKFNIFGIVDLIEEDGEVHMYDLKTHDVDYVLEHKEDYKGQLHVYAYVWEKLYERKVDKVSIVAIGENEQLRQERKDWNGPVEDFKPTKWNPVVTFDLEETAITEEINRFGQIVDCIENRQFYPRVLDVNDQNTKDDVKRFCSNCDIRFSCPSYTNYAAKASKRNKQLQNTFSYYENSAEDEEILEEIFEEAFNWEGFYFE
jgi:hypothetical protein